MSEPRSFQDVVIQRVDEEVVEGEQNECGGI